MNLEEQTIVEKSLLGCLLLDEEAWHHISDVFSPEIFILPEHREIAVGMLQLVKEGLPIDSTLLLKRTESPEARRSCFEAAQGIGVTSNARYYALQLRDDFLRRKMRLAVIKASEKQGDVKEELSKLINDLLSLEVGKKNEAVSIGDAILELGERLEREAKEDSSSESSLISTGFQTLDNFVGGFRPGVPHVYAARPGMGKSSLAIAFAHSLGSRGIPVGVFWLEDTTQDFASRFMSHGWKIPATKFRHGSRFNDQWDRFGTAAEQGARYPVHIDDVHGITIEEITYRMRQMHRKFGCRVFILDHLGEVDVQAGSKERNDLAIGRAMKMYRDTAKDLKACPIVFAQMNRQSERRTDGAPKLSDLDESGKIEQAARVVGFLDRPKDESGNFTGTLNILLKKNTGGPPDAMVKLKWNDLYMSLGE